MSASTRERLPDEGAAPHTWSVKNTLTQGVGQLIPAENLPPATVERHTMFRSAGSAHLSDKTFSETRSSFASGY